MNLLSALQRHFDFAIFRPGQQDAITHLLAGRDTLVVMPTGAGKSLIYQLTALLLPGTTLVVSPLIALMKDQVDTLTRRGIPATAVNSTIPTGEQTRRLAHMQRGDYRLVYLAPERLRHRTFTQALAHTRVSLLAVDEAHCISQWGHDFRPDYLHLAAARAQMGHPTTVALTATATPKVQGDILKQLGLPQAERIVTGFNRPNLTLEVRYTPNPEDKLRFLHHFLSENSGAGIIYVGTRREAEEVADFVREVVRRPARAYHAGLESEVRSEIQDAFMAGRLNLVAATNAFGMGIDRADIRFVLHFSIPGTLEAYYQEAGRAGRDGKPARCVLLYAPRDRALQEWFIENDAPSPKQMESIYQAVRRRAREDTAILTLNDLALLTGVQEVPLRVGLELLERMGTLHRLGDEGPRLWLEVAPWSPARLRVIMAEVEGQRAYKRRQLARMVQYAETDTCRRQHILDHFGDPGPAEAPACCDNCLNARPSPKPPPAPQRAPVEALPTPARVALAMLDTVHRLPRPVGRKRLAQILKGSRARAVRNMGYDRSPYYGRLADLTLGEIQSLIGQLIGKGYLKMVGGELPVIRLTPQGRRALTQQEAIAIHVPGHHQPERGQRKREEREAGGTVAYTEQLFRQGMTPEAIATHRGLKASTIYNHLAKLIAAGSVQVGEVVPPEVLARVRAAIAQVDSTTAISPIAALLPEDISYGVIRCVVAAWEREQGTPDRQPPEVSAGAAAELVHRIVDWGRKRERERVPDLIAALTHENGNVRRLAASALGKIGDAQAMEPLVALLEQEKKPQVRQYAIKALGRIGDPRARPMLERVRANPQEREYNRRAARRALSRLWEGSPSVAHPTQDAEEDVIAAYLAHAHPRSLSGPWETGWALGFHSRFSGAEWTRTEVGELAYRLKYGGEIELAEELADRLLALSHAHPELTQVDVVLPVPSSQHRATEPVGLLAAALAQRLGIPVHTDWLVKTRETRPQKEMRTLAQKRHNVAGAFAVRGAVRDCRVLVVDDLYDSGATLEEATRVLQQAGARAVLVMTLTRTIHSDA